MKVIRTYKGLLVLFLFASALCHARDLPSLSDTRLFTKQVRDCQPVDMAEWTHPTRTLLVENHVEIDRLELCNDRKYPVFYVRFPYDPQGDAKSYFGPLLDKMRAANGGWPYAFVALSDNTTMTVTYRPNGYADVDFERFQP